MREDTRGEDIRLLTVMVRGAYDLQLLRMQTGIRLVANFRSKLFPKPQPGSNPRTNSGPKSRSKPTSVSEPEISSNPDEDSDAEAKKVIDLLRESYKNLMAGVARNRTLPAERGFKGDELISTWAELAINHQFFTLEAEEDKQFRLLEKQLEKIPIYSEYLVHQVGIGAAMAGVIISCLDPAKARHASNFWSFAGLDIGPDGRGRSRRAEHLVERTYIDRDGEEKTRQSITYEPFLKTKLMGVLAGSFIRLGSPWRQVYDGYKNRLKSDPQRIKVELVEWKRRRKRGEDVSQLWTPGRIDAASKRYMIKQFLLDLWRTWRALEGLPVTEPYAVAKLGYPPHAAE